MNGSTIGFFSVLKGTFTNLDIFPKLLNNSWWRTFFYLLIWVVLVGSIVGFMQYKRIKPTISAFEVICQQNFGNYIISDNKNNLIYPETNPEKSRLVDLQNYCSIFYPGSTGIKDIPIIEPKIFVIWYPQYLLIGAKQSEGNIFFQKFNFGSQTQPIQTQNYSGSLASLLKDTTKLDFAKLPSTTNTKDIHRFHIDTLIQLITQTTIIYFIGNNIIIMLACVLLFTGVSSFMYNLSAKNRALNVTGTKLWKLGIYASFPVLVVAAAFPALELPFLSFDTVYTLGLIIYWLKVISYTEKAFTEEISSNDNLNQ
jgi:hypothetical protein